MKIAPIKWLYLCCQLCLVCCAQTVFADGFPDTSGAYLPASAPVAIPRPTVDHPALLLEDGRLLVAGGAAISNAYASHPVSLDSEVWDAETGQWQALGNDLRFEGNQRLHLNQLPDGRVLFFASREGQNVKPEYQARLWNPATNAVERLPVAIKSAAGTDIAVLNDGQVLIVNGLEGSADFWNSGTNTLTHTEVPLLENLRWRALPLANGQVLLVETVPDVPVEGKKTAEHSTTVRWDADEDDEWKRIGDLPVPLKQSSLLDETDDGSVRATIDGFVYLLPEEAAEWSEAGKAMQPQPVNAAGANGPTGASASPAAPSFGTTGSERSEWEQYTEVWNDFKWIAFAIAIPIVLYLVLRRLEEKKLAFFMSYTHTLMLIAAIGFVSFLLWMGTYSYAERSVRFSSNECLIDPLPNPELSNANTKLKVVSETQQWASCVDTRAGILGSIYFNVTKKRIMSLPAVPCLYVGIWSTTRDGVPYKVTFTDDSLFTAIPQSDDRKKGMTISGAWGVSNGEMIWIKPPNMLYEEPIVQRVEPESRSRFTLKGEGGAEDVYQLVDAIKSNTCSL